MNAVGLLVQAVKQAGADPKAVIAALAHAHYDGVAGPLTIVNNYPAEITYIGRVGADGKITVLEHSAEVQPELHCRKH